MVVARFRTYMFVATICGAPSTRWAGGEVGQSIDTNHKESM